MSLYCYFFRYNLDTSSFELCGEASGVEEAGIARLKQDPKELYVERRFASPQDSLWQKTWKATFSLQRLRKGSIHNSGYCSLVQVQWVQSSEAML